MQPKSGSSNTPTRRTILSGTGSIVAASILPDWLPFTGDDEPTLEERVEQLEADALRFGSLEDRPDPSDGFGSTRYLADDRIIYEVDDGEWTAAVVFDDPQTAIGSMFFTENETATEFDAEGEWSAIEGGSVAGELREFTHLESENQLRYDSDDELFRHVVVTMAVTPEGNESNTTHELTIFNNGEFVDTRKQIEIDQDDDIEHITLANVIDFSAGEVLYPALRSTEGTPGLVVLNMSMTIY